MCTLAPVMSTCGPRPAVDRTHIDAHERGQVGKAPKGNLQGTDRGVGGREVRLQRG